MGCVKAVYDQHDGVDISVFACIMWNGNPVAREARMAACDPPLEATHENVSVAKKDPNFTNSMIGTKTGQIKLYSATLKEQDCIPTCTRFAKLSYSCAGESWRG